VAERLDRAIAQSLDFARFVASVGTTIAPPPTFAATAWSSRSRRAASATRCPAAASCTASSAPIPLLAPVMTMCLESGIARL
jgi:hypothetical protein